MNNTKSSFESRVMILRSYKNSIEKKQDFQFLPNFLIFLAVQTLFRLLQRFKKIYIAKLVQLSDALTKEQHFIFIFIITD